LLLSGLRKELSVLGQLPNAKPQIAGTKIGYVNRTHEMHSAKEQVAYQIKDKHAQVPLYPNDQSEGFRFSTFAPE